MSTSSIYFKYAILSAMVFQNVGVVLLMRFSRLPSNEGETPVPMFLTSTAIVMQEAAKISVCILVLLKQHNFNIITTMKHIIAGSPFKDVLIAGVPGVVYLVQNSLNFIAVSHLSAGLFQLTYQSKLISTAMLMVIFLKKKLTKTQWMSIFGLFVGMALVQLASATDTQEKEDSKKWLGVAAALGAASCSGIAGVSVEAIMKNVGGSNDPKVPKSLWLKNVHLGLYGSIFGLFSAYYNDGAEIAEYGFFHGYNKSVIGIIALQAGGGLLVATILKYLDNILKNFATGLGCVLIPVIGSYLFGEHLNFMFMVGAFMIVGNMIVYNLGIDYVETFLGAKPISAIKKIEVAQ